MISLREINAALKLAGLSAALKIAGAEKPEKPRNTKDLRLLAPDHFHEFLRVFEKGKAQELPPHRPYDHSIPLKPCSAPPFGPLYGMSVTPLKIGKHDKTLEWPQ